MFSISRAARGLLAAALLATAASPLVAQDPTPEPGADQPPLLQMLALVPNTPQALDGTPFIGYVDYVAIEQARADVPSFESWNAFDTALDVQDDDSRLWLQNSMRIQTGPDFYLRYLRQFAETEALVGFDVFDIDRALVFGQPPERGQILQGDFDVDAVTEAFVARDYATAQNNGVVLLSRADGEPGTRLDVTSRDIANPFGGDLGRREPIAVTDSYILNSPYDALLESMVNAFVGYRPSLYTQPDLVAAAEAVSIGQGQLLQALFLNPLEMTFPGIDPAIVLTPNPELDALIESTGYGPLPLYSAAVLADLQDANDQVALVALVYADEATARAAADELSARLRTLRLRGDETLDPMIAMVDGAQVAKSNVYFSPGTGRYVALASVRYPMPPNVLVDRSTGEPLDEGDDASDGMFAMSGRLFRMWNENLMTRSFDILTVTE